ncbi:hypothetical protein JCM16303_005427 [Sporobolomyces ruberrimus]
MSLASPNERSRPILDQSRFNNERLVRLDLFPLTCLPHQSRRSPTCFNFTFDYCTPSQGSTPLPTNLKLRNCATSGLRRVKCERPPGSTSCINCTSRGLVALFGSTTSPSRHTSNIDVLAIERPTKRTRQGSQAAGSSTNPELSQTSTVARLVTGDLQASLTGSLPERSGAPTLKELREGMRVGKDFSKWSEKREGACIALGEEGKEVWLMRKEFGGKSNLENLVKSHDVGRNERLRNIFDAVAKERLMSSGLAWTAFGRDAIMSAMSGRTSVFSDDDCFLLAKILHSPPHELSRCLIERTKTPLIQPWQENQVQSSVGYVRLENPESFTTSSNTLSRLDERSITDSKNSIVDSNCTLVRLVEAMRRMRKEVFDSVQQVRIVKTGLPFLLQRIVNQRSAEHDTKTSLESRSSFVEAARILRVDEYEALPGPAKGSRR